MPDTTVSMDSRSSATGAPHGEVSPPKSGIKAFLGETLIITATAAVLYLWGMLYYSRLTSLLALDVSLFSIPFNDVLVAPWGSAVLAVCFAAAAAMLWQTRSFAAFFVYHLLRLPVVGVRNLARRLLPSSVIQNAAKFADARFAAISAYLLRTTPSPLLDEIDKLDPAALYRCLAPFFGVVLVVVGGIFAEDAATRRLTRYKQLNDTTPDTTIICEDTTPIQGIFVEAIGDAVVVRTGDSSNPRFEVVRSGKFKRLSRTVPAWLLKPTKAPTGSVPTPNGAQTGTPRK